MGIKAVTFIGRCSASSSKKKGNLRHGWLGREALFAGAIPTLPLSSNELRGCKPPNQPACEKQPRCLCRQFPPPLFPQCQTFIYITGNWIKRKIWAVLLFASYSVKRKAPLLSVLFRFKSRGYYQVSRFISLRFIISFKCRLQFILTLSWSSRWIFMMTTHCFSGILLMKNKGSETVQVQFGSFLHFTCTERLVPETTRFLVIFRVFQETYCQQISIFQ